MMSFDTQVFSTSSTAASQLAGITIQASHSTVHATSDSDRAIDNIQRSATILKTLGHEDVVLAHIASAASATLASKLFKLVRCARAFISHDCAIQVFAILSRNLDTATGIGTEGTSYTAIGQAATHSESSRSRGTRISHTASAGVRRRIRIADQRCLDIARNMRVVIQACVASLFSEESCLSNIASKGEDTEFTQFIELKTSDVENHTLSRTSEEDIDTFSEVEGWGSIVELTSRRIGGTVIGPRLTCCVWDTS